MKQEFQLSLIHQAEMLSDNSLEFIKGGMVIPLAVCGRNSCIGNTGSCDVNKCRANSDSCKTNECVSNKVSAGSGECKTVL